MVGAVSPRGKSTATPYTTGTGLATGTASKHVIGWAAMATTGKKSTAAKKSTATTARQRRSWHMLPCWHMLRCKLGGCSRMAPPLPDGCISLVSIIVCIRPGCSSPVPASTVQRGLLICQLEFRRDANRYNRCQADYKPSWTHEVHGCISHASKTTVWQHPKGNEATPLCRKPAETNYCRY